MKKTLTTIAAIALFTLTSFSNDKQNIVVNFELENHDLSSYHIKLTSKSNPNDEIVFEIPALSIVNFEIKKSKSGWMDSEMAFLNIPQHNLRLSGIYDGTSANKGEIIHSSDDELCNNGTCISNLVKKIKWNITTNNDKAITGTTDSIHKKYKVIIENAETQLTPVETEEKKSK